MSSYLIIKLGALGDIVMASAMLPELRRTPGNSITWVVGNGAVPLLEHTGMVDEIIPVDTTALFGSSIITACREGLRLSRLLWGRRFDVCLIPYRDWRYHLLRLGTHCRTIRTFRGLRSIIPGRYHAHEYIRLALGKELSPEREYPYPPLQLPPFCTPEVPVPTILLAPGGSYNPAANDIVRRWPVENYVQLARKAIDAGYSVGLIGTGQDAELERSFEGLPVVSFINKTTLQELLQLLCQTQILVTHDNGPMHLMKWAGGKLIVLFGPTQACEKIIPAPSTVIMQAENKPPCQPCYNGKTYAQCADNICLRSISPDHVFTNICKLLTTTT